MPAPALVGAEVMPAVAAGGRAVARSMPDLANNVKKFAPAFFDKLRDVMKTDPITAANAIAKSDNGLLAQGMMLNAVRTGVSPDIVFGSVPHLTEADRAILLQHHAAWTTAARNAVDKSQVNVAFNGDVLPPGAEITSMIERACRRLGISSDDLGDLITAFDVVKNSDIAQYQAYFTKIGAKYL